MSKIFLGLIAGTVFGALDVGLMLPMSFPDKTTALLGAFRQSLCHWIRHWLCPVTGLARMAGGPLCLVCSSAFPTPLSRHKYVPSSCRSGGIGGLVIGGLIHGWRAHI
jgi:hypothetical protein